MAVVLFVCTGNITRSMTAQYLFQDVLDKKGNSSFKVVSAGILPDTKNPIFSKLVTLFGKLGIDIKGHKPQPITQELVAQADYIVCMTHFQRKYLQHEYGAYSYLYNELAKVASEDVQDNAEAGITKTELPDFLSNLFSYFRETIETVYDKLIVLDEAALD